MVYSLVKGYLALWEARLPRTLKGPKDHINIRILHSGSKAQDTQDCRNHGCRILMFMRSFGPLALTLRASNAPLGSLQHQQAGTRTTRLPRLGLASQHGHYACITAILSQDVAATGCSVSTGHEGLASSSLKQRSGLRSSFMPARTSWKPPLSPRSS